jgi:membrane protein YdbS with pleckstrin-like domain
MTAALFPDKVIHLTATETARVSQKARIHNGAIGDKQPGSGAHGRSLAVPQGSCKTAARTWKIGIIEAEAMGRYIDDILQPGEKVLYSTNAHWIFYLPAIGAGMVAIFFLVVSRVFVDGSLMLACLALAVIAALFALYQMLTAWFHRWTTETDVTNLRVVHKTGFIKRRTFEMSLDKVESVDVNQSILGRLMNYGDVTVRGVGEGAETIKTIASPLDFRNHITAR